MHCHYKLLIKLFCISPINYIVYNNTFSVSVNLIFHYSMYYGLSKYTKPACIVYRGLVYYSGLCVQWGSPYTIAKAGIISVKSLTFEISTCSSNQKPLASAHNSIRNFPFNISTPVTSVM